MPGLPPFFLFFFSVLWKVSPALLLPPSALPRWRAALRACTCVLFHAFLRPSAVFLLPPSPSVARQPTVFCAQVFRPCTGRRDAASTEQGLAPAPTVLIGSLRLFFPSCPALPCIALHFFRLHNHRSVGWVDASLPALALALQRSMPSAHAPSQPPNTLFVRPFRLRRSGCPVGTFRTWCFFSPVHAIHLVSLDAVVFVTLLAPCLARCGLVSPCRFCAPLAPRGDGGTWSRRARQGLVTVK